MLSTWTSERSRAWQIMHPHKQRNGWTPRLAHGGRRKKSAKDSISYTRSIPATVELFTSQINARLATVGDVWLPKRLNFSWERESAHCNLAMTYSLSYLDESEYMDSYSSPGFTLTLDQLWEEIHTHSLDVQNWLQWPAWHYHVHFSLDGRYNSQ